MSKFKQAALTLAMVGLLSAQAHASEAQVPSPQVAQPMSAFSETDINAMFEQTGKPMQLAALSGQEMKETEGAYWLNLAGGFVGGISGAYGYMTSSVYNSNISSTDVAWGLTRSIGLGAAWGAIRPTQSIGSALGSLTFSAGRGALLGYGSGRGWW